MCHFWHARDFWLPLGSSVGLCKDLLMLGKVRLGHTWLRIPIRTILILIRTFFFALNFPLIRTLFSFLIALYLLLTRTLFSAIKMFKFSLLALFWGKEANSWN